MQIFTDERPLPDITSFMALHYSGVGCPYAHVATGIFYLVILDVLILWSLSIVSFCAASVLGIAIFKSSCYIFGTSVSTRWWPKLSSLIGEATFGCVSTSCSSSPLLLAACTTLTDDCNLWPVCQSGQLPNSLLPCVILRVLVAVLLLPE